MDSRVRWLRISYWVGAIGDFAIAGLVLDPERMNVASYVYPMGLASAMSFSWGCMLLWADRKPVERRWILLPTILVGSMLLLAGLFSIYVGAISAWEYGANFVLLPGVVVLWTLSYARARDLGA